MIKVKYMYKEKPVRRKCDHCGISTVLTLDFEIENKPVKDQQYLPTKFTLCEDCANAIRNLFHFCMENGENYVYDKDEYYKSL